MDSSYDELLKQVESLKAENSHLRQELNDNSSHLSKLENEASTMKDILSKNNVEIEDDSDTDINYDDEDGIHVFQQGGGGESRDLNPTEDDISPNDIGPVKPFCRPLETTAATPQQQNGQVAQNNSDTTGQMSQAQKLDTEIWNKLRSLHHERSTILAYIEEEDRQRKWFISQLDTVRQKLEKLPMSEGPHYTLGRRKIEYEAKQIQESFEQNLGTHEQISQRQEARLQRISAIETEMLQLQSQQKLQMEGPSRNPSMSLNGLPEQTGMTQEDDLNTSTIATQTAEAENSDVHNMSSMDPNASMNLASLYHGAWPLSPMKKDSSNTSSRDGSIQNATQQQEVASIMSFNSSNTTGTHASHPPAMSPRQHGAPPMSHAMIPQQGQGQAQQDGNFQVQHPQQLGTKVEMVYSLLSMLGTHDKDDMSRTLLAMSSSQDSCIAMRQSGCMPLLIQLLHGSDKDSGLLGNTRGSKSARARAAAALHNIVHSHPDDKRGRREARVLRLLEQIRAHCDQLKDTSSSDDEDAKNSKEGHEMDHHPGPAVAALMKLSFDEEHRHAICSLGGVQAIAELIQTDTEVHGNTTEQYNITMRRYGCMALTNLTFGDGTNKALLCSMKGFMESLVAQLESDCEDLNQVAASVLRNLSWKADLQSKKTLRIVGAATTLMKGAMKVKKEATLKSILSALWNLSAHGSENKADICAVDGALEFLVSTLTYKSPSKTTAVIENGGGVLRNISSHITVREDYRQILRKHGCLQILLKQLRSPSLNIVSNACGTLWNLSARCPEDQQALWDMGAVGMLRNLVHSKHQMIAMGSSAALKNLLTACPNIKSMGMDKKTNMNRPSLHVRKQKALAEEIDPSLSETCENLESPRDSPTENNRSEKDHSRFNFPVSSNVMHNDVEPRRPIARGPVYPKSSSGENTPMSDSRLMSPQRVARSGSQDSVGSTHSDISHDRSRFHNTLKSAKQYHERQGGSLDRHHGTPLQRYNSDGSCERSHQGQHPNSRILQVMKEVAKHAGIESDASKAGSGGASKSATPRKDGSFSLPHALLYRSYTGPPSSQSQSYPQYGGANVFNKIQSASMYADQDDQPIDYSMKLNSKTTHSNKTSTNHPPIPKFGNYVGPTFDHPTSVPAPTMHHSYSGQKAAQNLFHIQQHTVAPVIPQFSAYAETDLDSDQPTDFSRRFAESHEEGEIAQPVAYGMQYQDTDPHCAECKLEVARRTNDRLEQYMPGDDQVKTFYTEGTPRNYLSTANSLTDLSSKMEKEEGCKHMVEAANKQVEEEEEDDSIYSNTEKNSGCGSSSHYGESEKHSGTGSQSTNPDTGTTVIANYHVATQNLQQVVASKSPNQDETTNRSFHAPNEDDNSPDQIKTYCEEGTPICFSRVSSLSSLHSSDAIDRQVESSTKARQQNGLHSINENDCAKTPPREIKTLNSIMAPPRFTPNSGRHKMLNDSDSHGPDSAEKEHKTVTFNDDHQVEETPLMFSRCSSLGSLSSFDAHSVHSSVISDYSRRASENVSPSELPDSPSETMPTSPAKSPEPTDSKKEKKSEGQSQDPPEIGDLIAATPETVLYKPKPTVPEDGKPQAKRALEESSTISCDEAPVIYADEGTPPHFSETNSILSMLTIDDAEKTKIEQKPDSLNPCTIDESDTEKSILNKSDDKENSSMSEVSEGEEDILKQCMSSAMPRKMRRSSSDNTIKKKVISPKSESPKVRNGGKSFQGQKGKVVRSLHASISESFPTESDTVKTYASEDIPTVDKPMKVKHQFKTQSNRSLVPGVGIENEGDSTKAFAEEDAPFKEQKQMSTRIPLKMTNQKPVLAVPPSEDNFDTVKSYASEGHPTSNLRPAIKQKPFSKIQDILSGNLDVLDDYDDAVKSYAEEGTPFTGSAPMSPRITSSKPNFPVAGVKFNPALLTQMDYPMDEDAPKSYAIEGTPYNMSEPTSPKHTVKKAPPPPPVPEKPKQQIVATTQKVDPTVLAMIQDIHTNDDTAKSYAVEGTPFNISEPTSPKSGAKNISTQETQVRPTYSVPPFPSVIVPDSGGVEDTIKTYATEDTPVSFSHATSLSDLSIITTNDEIIQSKEDKEEAGPVPPEPEQEETEVKCLDDTHSDNSSLFDDNEELLSDLMQSAMPKGKGLLVKGSVSRKLDMDRAAEGAESKDSVISGMTGFHPQRTSSLASGSEQVLVQNIPKVVQAKAQSAASAWGDAYNTYVVEDTPNNFSSATSLSDLTVESDMPSQIDHVSSTTMMTNQMSVSRTATSGALTSADESVFCHSVGPDSSDSLRVYNVEGTPTTFSRNDSLSSLSMIDEEVRDSSAELSKQGTDSAKKMPPPALPVRTLPKEKSKSTTGSDTELQREVEGQSSDEKSVSLTSDSGSSLNRASVSETVEKDMEVFTREKVHKEADAGQDKSSSDEDEDLELEQALLEECMNLALPKSRPKGLEEKPQINSKIPRTAKMSARGYLDYRSENEADSRTQGRSKKGRELVHEYEVKRMTRSCSSADEFEKLNHTIGNVITHESRSSQWRNEQAHNMSADFVFAKPSNDYRRPHRGSWRRSRSQDSDGFLKRQKDTSNMEIAQSGGHIPQRYRNSEQSIPTYVEIYQDNRMLEEHQNHRGQTELQKRKMRDRERDSGSREEKVDYEKSDHLRQKEMDNRRRHYSDNTEPENRNNFVPGTNVDSRRRHHSENMDIEFQTRYVHQQTHNNDAIMYSCGIDNYGFNGGSSEDVENIDSGDVTILEKSGNITMTMENVLDLEAALYQESLRQHKENSFDEGFSPEDEEALQLEASMVVTEIQNNRMVGSAVDDDMFIENETLSLVSGGYMSDTASEVSITWSANSEKNTGSEFSESTISQSEEMSIASSGPRIVKPSGRQRQEEINSKGIRGRRKPLYTSKSVPSPNVKPNNPVRTEPQNKFNKSASATRTGAPLRGPSNMNMTGRKGTVTKTHPQASSTPTKSSPAKSKLQKPSPPQSKPAVANKPATKNSPSRLPTATARKPVNSAERPKPPVKQGTFTKESAGSKNVPVIVDIDDSPTDKNGNSIREVKMRQKRGDNSQEQRRSRDSDGNISESWSKALGSYNFVVEKSGEDKKENQAPNRRPSGSTNLNAKNSGSGSNLAGSKAKPTGTFGNKSGAKMNNKFGSGSNLKKTFSGTSLTKSGSGASLNKSGSGASLNKSGSGQALNRSGLNKAGSDRTLNRGGSNTSLTKFTGSKGDLKKSDSNASLKNNSRPSTPVGRKSSGSITAYKKVETKPQNSSQEEKRTGLNSSGKKQANSRIAGLWKREDSSQSEHAHASPRGMASRLPVSTGSTPNRSPRSATSQSTGRSPPGKTNASRVQNTTNTGGNTDSSRDGVSRSSTYDKLNSINDSSQIPSLDDDEHDDSHNVTIEVLPPKSLSYDQEEIKGDYVQLRIIQGSESSLDAEGSYIIKSPTKSKNQEESFIIISPTKSNKSEDSISSTSKSGSLTKSCKSDEDSIGNKSETSSMSRSGDDFDLKSLEKRIDSSTWKKKKSDLDSSCLPNADDTSKSLAAVKAVLDASVVSESMNETFSSIYNSSTIEGSYLSQGSRTVSGSSWRRYREESYASVDHSEDEGDSVWVRRDEGTSKSEPELNKHLLNPKKSKKEKGESRSFLPIKAMKSMFSSSKKEKSSKSGSKMSLSSSKESIYSHKVDMNEIVKAIEKVKEKEKKEKAKEKEKKEKEKSKLEKEAAKEKAKSKDKSKSEKEKKSKAKKEDSRRSSTSSVGSRNRIESVELNYSDVSNIDVFDKSEKASHSFSQESGMPSGVKTSPQAALVPPFNYTPKENAKPAENGESRDQSDVFVKPLPKKPVVSSNTNSNTPQHMTKTEMLLARRRQQSYINNVNKGSPQENSAGEMDISGQKRQGCMVTTV